MSDERLDGIETRWSLIRQAHAADQGASVAQARNILVMRYASAIRRYLGGILKDPDQTDDLAQEAMVRLLRGDFAGADPNRGRFRDLLKTAVRNMVRNHWDKQNRRRSTSADLDLLADASETKLEASWLGAWQSNVLDHAWAALKDVERKNPGNPAHSLLQWRAEFPDESSEQFAARLTQKVGTPVRADAARQMLRRARLRFAELLMQEVALGLDDASPQELEEELAALGLLEHVRDFLPADWRERGRLQTE
ncbi:MAG: sigma-70 family RNA polymerase sigma factor [Planctomycetes bacterium]|nr:sigma-70 family RNA polymerase sigma factor [Planctomycetota bacterium]